MAKRQRRRRQERRRRHVESRWTTRRSVITGAGLTAGAVLGMGGVAHATDFMVTNLSDGPLSGPTGSLRKAITDANAHLGPDRVLFDSSLSGTIDLAYGALPITETLEVKGPGPDTVGIDDYFNYSRVFSVDPDVTGDPVTISGLSMSYANIGGFGGAISNTDARLTVDNSLLFDNYASSGGAIADAGDYASGAQTTIKNTTIVGNSAPGGSGGGIRAAMQVGKVINSTIVGNYASGNGGGGFAGANGGSFLDSTVAGNYSYASGGGIADGSGGAHTAIVNTIVGGNGAHLGGADLIGADPFDVNFSLIENTTGATVSSSVSGSNIVGIDPQMARLLTNNEGAPPTAVPNYNSPVIDQVKTAGGVTTDERGFTRPSDLAGFSNSAATGAVGAD